MARRRMAFDEWLCGGGTVINRFREYSVYGRERILKRYIIFYIIERYV